MPLQQARLITYLQVWQTVQDLKLVEPATPIANVTGRSRTSVLDMILQLERVLRKQTTESGSADFQFFEQILGLHENFQKFAEELEDTLPETALSERTNVLGKERWGRLQDHIALFEKIFNLEVAQWPIFIPEEPQAQLKFLSHLKFLRDDHERELFEKHLPRIAQSYFKDAGFCLGYNLPDAAVGLALRAIEATLRYFYFRHCGPMWIKGGRRDRSPDWGYMLIWLWNEKSKKGQLPSELCFLHLKQLKDEYRNVVAHGRTYTGVGSFGKAQTIFQHCLDYALILAEELKKHRHLKIRLKISPEFDLDVAVATFIYKWNPEFPPLDPKEMLECVPSIPKGSLTDASVMSFLTLPDETENLSRRVIKFLGIPANYAGTLDSLLEHADRSGSVGKELTKIRFENPFDETIFGDPNPEKAKVLLEDAWIKFDDFLKTF